MGLPLKAIASQGRERGPGTPFLLKPTPSLSSWEPLLRPVGPGCTLGSGSFGRSSLRKCTWEFPVVPWGLGVLSLRLRGCKCFMRTSPANVPDCLRCLLPNELPRNTAASNTAESFFPVVPWVGWAPLPCTGSAKVTHVATFSWQLGGG